ncbi:protein phosphatase 1 regulatory subunit 3A-like isoform X2 [Trachinotus anak]|uniref:protein phosphatase 1 regulatory subunit 3A-like isoform X2 n=1 Tax=Trachinotus anak TaxID=443729 RepID=UPI0039F1A969
MADLQYSILLHNFNVTAARLGALWSVPPSKPDRRQDRPLRPSHIMEALYIQPLEEDGMMMEEEEWGKSGEQEKGGNEALPPTGSTTDEETDEDSEPEPPPVVRRKVSFADAFGLNLVSVKEFDDVEVESEVSQLPEMEATNPLEEFYMSCLFTVPSSPEELDQRLQVQMIELESIELLPGTTTLRGIIRVVNLCYSKSVYARITLDCWNSYFDLLAEYLPGSSDKKTDRFTFKYTLIPPFEKEGTRVDFCLRYETPVGTFWANNKDINYVLFCHQKGQVKEQGPQVLEESPSYKSKKSCLRANRSTGQ